MLPVTSSTRRCRERRCPPRAGTAGPRRSAAVAGDADLVVDVRDVGGRVDAGRDRPHRVDRAAVAGRGRLGRGRQQDRCQRGDGECGDQGAGAELHERSPRCGAAVVATRGASAAVAGLGHTVEHRRHRGVRAEPHPGSGGHRSQGSSKALRCMLAASGAKWGSRGAATQLDHTSEAGPSGRRGSRVVPGWAHPGSGDMPEEEAPEEEAARDGMSRRTILRVGAVGTTGAALTAGGVGGPYLAHAVCCRPTAPSPRPGSARRRPVLQGGLPDQPADPRAVQGRAADPEGAPAVPKSEFSSWAYPPGPGAGQQNSLRNERHQMWPRRARLPGPDRLQDRRARPHARLHHLQGPADRPDRPARGLLRRAGKTYAAGTQRTFR